MLEKNWLDQTSDARFMFVWNSNQFSTFVKTSNCRNFHAFLIIFPYIWSKTDKRKTISPMVVCCVFSRRYQKIIRLDKKVIGHRMRIFFMSIRSSNFQKHPFNVIFVETSNGRNFFLEYLLDANLFLNMLIFLRYMR